MMESEAAPEPARFEGRPGGGAMWRSRIVLGSVLALVLCSAAPAGAVVEIMRGADAGIDPKVMRGIEDLFDRIEMAFRAEDLPGLMALYSDGYIRRGMIRTDLERIWQDLFRQFDQIASHHFFSAVEVELLPSGHTFVRVTCRGSVIGLPAIGERDEPMPAGRRPFVNIDVWAEVTHYLVLEQGAWKIAGHDPTHPSDRLPGPGVHLLF
jgi:hypothetical protein